MKTLLALYLLTVCALLPACHTGFSETSSALNPSDLRYISMQTTKGRVILELDHDRAPITVDNFLAHMNAGDYDGTIFHRVISTFVIQGGGFTPDLQDRGHLAETSGYKDAPIKNEWTNGLKNTRGTIAMARDTDPDTATREFYINVADNPRLNTPRETTGKAGYAVFGRVISGMSIVDAIKDGQTTARPDIIVDGEGMKDVPVNPVVILSVRQVPARPATPDKSP